MLHFRRRILTKSLQFFWTSPYRYHTMSRTTQPSYPPTGLPQRSSQSFAKATNPPIVDMERLILTMMGWAGVSEEQLKEQGEIATSFGQTLSWTYLCWVREHPVHHWDCPICILYGSGDNMTPRHTVEEYTHQHNAKLTVLEGGEHWFHTPEQHTALQKWEETEV